MIIKAVTLIQPWATLIALGEKQFETRSWSAQYKGLLGIHAGMKIDFEALKNLRIKSSLMKYGIDSPDKLPTGCIVAISQIFDCVKMVESREARYGVKVPGYRLSDQEYAFGYYEPGRWAWILADIRRPATPIPVKGKQRLWDFDINGIKFNGQEWD
jgi:hypothetical protein